MNLTNPYEVSMSRKFNYHFCVYSLLNAERKPFRLHLPLCQSQTVFVMTYEDKLSPISLPAPNITQCDWTSGALCSERKSVIILHLKDLWCLYPLSTPNIKYMMHYTGRNIQISLCLLKAALPCWFHKVGHAQCKIIPLVFGMCGSETPFWCYAWMTTAMLIFISAYFDANFLCSMHFYLEHKGPLLHVNHQLWPSENLPVQACISAALHMRTFLSLTPMNMQESTWLS